MFHYHALDALADHCGGRGNQTQLFPALRHLLLHFFIIGSAACTLYQLITKHHKHAVNACLERLRDSFSTQG